MKRATHNTQYESQIVRIWIALAVALMLLAALSRAAEMPPMPTVTNAVVPIIVLSQPVGGRGALLLLQSLVVKPGWWTVSTNKAGCLVQTNYLIKACRTNCTGTVYWHVKNPATSLTIAWNYPTNQPDVVFIVQSSPTLSKPLNQWPVKSIVKTNGLTVKISGSEFFVVRASNTVNKLVSEYAIK